MDIIPFALHGPALNSCNLGQMALYTVSFKQITFIQKENRLLQHITLS
jgi:hypothetical protein